MNELVTFSQASQAGRELQCDSTTPPRRSEAVPAVFLHRSLTEYLESMSTNFFQVLFLPLIGSLFFVKTRAGRETFLWLAGIELSLAIACWGIAKAIG